MPDQLDRKIYFYKIIPSAEIQRKYMKNEIMDGNFRGMFEEFRRDPYSFLDANIPLKQVIEIGYSSERSLIMIRDDPKEFNLIPWVGGSERGIITARLGYGKEKDLPTKIDAEGHENGIALDKSRKEKLYFPTHFVVFPNGIIGMERYRDGPKSYQLKYFLSKYLFGDLGIVELMEVYDKEFIKELLKSPRIVSLYLKMAAAKYIYYMEHKRNMGRDSEDLLANFPYLLKPDVIEIRALVDGRIKKKRLSKDVVISIIGRIKEIDEELGIVEDLVVKYEDPKTHELKERHIFENKLISVKKVVRAREELSRVDSEDMYNKIIEAYNELKDEIEKFLKENE